MAEIAPISSNEIDLYACTSGFRATSDKARKFSGPLNRNMFMGVPALRP